MTARDECAYTPSRFDAHNRRRPAMASLQVRHSRSCPVCPGRQEAAAAADERKCGWQDRLHRRLDRERREGAREGRHRSRRGREATSPDRVRTRGGNDYSPPQHVRFTPFADDWLESLRRRSTTHSNYAVTLEYAKQVIGRRPLPSSTGRRARHPRPHRAGQPHRRSTKRARPREVSPTTLAKHLRHLGACLQAAAPKG